MNDFSPDEAREFLLGRLNYERTPARRGDLHLDRMVRLLDALGQPQTAAPVVHLAGTKGKGSTAAMISQLLTAEGRRVGLYTSPHLTRLEERIRLDNQPCESLDFVKLVNELAPVVEKMDAQGDSPTFFELSTALAMVHFAQSEVDVMVLETGLGGRLDSTNVCNPRVSVITSISFDHTRQLGNTLEKIATEKCGIIKQGRPVVSGVVTDPARSVIRETARRRDAPLIELGIDYFAHDIRLSSDPPATTFDYQSSRHELRELHLGLLGPHQATNAAIALATLELLEQRDESMPPALHRFEKGIIRDAMRNAHWPARLELVGRDPAVIVDVAHNVASAEALVATLSGCFPRERGVRRLVVAVSNDKDAEGICRVLIPEFDEVIVTEFVTNPRAIKSQQLKQIVDSISGDQLKARTEAIEQPREAWRVAAQRCRTGDGSLTCVAGSFFLAAELRDEIIESLAQSQ